MWSIMFAKQDTDAIGLPDERYLLQLKLKLSLNALQVVWKLTKLVLS